MDNRSLTIGNIYRSPNSNKQQDDKLYRLIDEVVIKSKKGVILVGDFNFPDINWDICHSNSYTSQAFIDTLQKNLLTQHVDFPTRIRGTDTPHILDLVLTDEPVINKIDEYAPLAKSDHSILLIETALTYYDISNCQALHIFHTVSSGVAYDLRAPGYI